MRRARFKDVSVSFEPSLRLDLGFSLALLETYNAVHSFHVKGVEEERARDVGHHQIDRARGVHQHSPKAAVVALDLEIVLVDYPGAVHVDAGREKTKCARVACLDDE